MTGDGFDDLRLSHADPVLFEVVSMAREPLERDEDVRVTWVGEGDDEKVIEIVLRPKPTRPRPERKTKDAALEARVARMVENDRLLRRDADALFASAAPPKTIASRRAVAPKNAVTRVESIRHGRIRALIRRRSLFSVDVEKQEVIDRAGHLVAGGYAAVIAALRKQPMPTSRPIPGLTDVEAVLADELRDYAEPLDDAAITDWIAQERRTRPMTDTEIEDALLGEG
jgi:hypothetical protein